MAQNKNPCNMTTFIIIIAKYEQNPSKRKGEDRYTRFDGWLGPKQYNRMHGKLDSSFPSVHLNFPLVVFLFFTLIHISVMTSYLVSDFHFSVTTCNIVFRYLNFSDIANEHIIPPLNIVRVILLWA
jgi:hypothetical protein